jgi:hypothetical protein
MRVVLPKTVRRAVRSSSEITAELFERAQSLSSLEDALSTVRDSSSGRLVFVGGEAGVGKTALVRVFCDRHSESARLLSGACDALFTARPLGPLLDVTRTTGGDLAPLVEEGARPHEVATALIEELKAHAPTILVLEDVHAADEATLDVLRLLGRRVEGVPVLIVATYRDDELDRAHPIWIFLGELGREDSVVRLKLAPLSPEAVAELAGPHQIDVEELYRKTGGNPFFVTEVLAGESGEYYVEALELPVFGTEPRAAIDRNDYEPIVNGRKFPELSAGVRVLVNIAHLLAHHRAALELGLPLPGLIMIDGINKNIGTAEYDAARVEDAWSQLMDLSNTLGDDLQVIVAANDVPPRLRPFVRLTLSAEDRLIPTADLAH